MSDVTPAGQPPRGADHPRWLLFVVGVAGAVLGYVLGAAGTTSEPPVAAGEAAPIEVPEATQASTTTTTDPLTERDLQPRPLGTEGRRLEDLVPGFQDTLTILFREAPEPILMVWSSYMYAPRRYQLPAVTGLTLNTTGTMAAALGSAAEEGRLVLYLGPPRSLRPAAFDVESVVWHHTDPDRLSWLHRVGPDDLELRVGRIEPSGELTSHEAITVIPQDALSWYSLACHADEGFIVSGFHRDPDDTRITWWSAGSIGPSGRELWNAPPAQRLFDIGCSMLIPDEASEGFEYWLAPDPTSAPRRVEWIDGANPIAAASVTADGERIALFFFDRFELWTVDGTLVLERPLSHRVLHAVWSTDGRFVVAAGERYTDDTRTASTNVSALIFIDTVDDTEHEIVFSHFPWVKAVRH